MVFHGFQKLTLLDFPGKVACTVFTSGCNLRCPFCHNASLALSREGEAFSEQTILDYLDKRAGVLDGICVTGGEPLLQEGLPQFLRRVRERSLLVKLDTNGALPAQLKALVEDGLVDYVAMDLKSDMAGYAQACGAPGINLDAIEESIVYLLSGKVDYEFRTTVVKGLHDEDILRRAAQSIRGARRYYLQKFVDSGDLIGTGYEAASDAEMRRYLDAVLPFVQRAALRGL